MPSLLFYRDDVVLLDGESDLALTGGVSVMLEPRKFSFANA